MSPVSRRQFMKLGLCAAATMTLPQMLWAADASSRALSFYHMHTGEKISLTYFEKGRYLTPAMQEFNHVLRDWRTNDVHKIDPALFDQLYALQQAVDTPGAYHVVCGYRCPKTNQMLHEHSNGVATHSLHLEGRAIDLSLPGKDLSHLHKAALSMQAGGVGYYPEANFIHLDTGHVRSWG